MIKTILIALGIIHPVPMAHLLASSETGPYVIERITRETCHILRDRILAENDAKADRWNNPVVPHGAVLVARPPRPVLATAHCLEI